MNKSDYEALKQLAKAVLDRVDRCGICGSIVLYNVNWQQIRDVVGEEE